MVKGNIHEIFFALNRGVIWKGPNNSCMDQPREGSRIATYLLTASVTFMLVATLLVVCLWIDTTISGREGFVNMALAKYLTLLCACIALQYIILGWTWGVIRLIAIIRDAKVQLLVVGTLLVISLSREILSILSSGIPHSYSLLMVLFWIWIAIEALKFPIAIIIAGILWFWPEKQIVWKDCISCSILVIPSSMILACILTFTGILSMVNQVFLNLSTLLANNPVTGILLSMLQSVGIFIVLLLLSGIGFRIIAACRSNGKVKNIL